MFQGKHDEAAAVMQKLYDSARDDADRRTALFTRSVIYHGRRPDRRRGEGDREGIRPRRAARRHGQHERRRAAHREHSARRGKTDEAAKRFWQANDLVEKSSLSAEVKEDVALADHFNKGRVALAKGDLATAKTEAAAYMSGSEGRHNAFRVRQAHELAGMIALKEKDYDGAIAHFAEANQQDPQVLYQTAQAYKGKGDAAKVKEWAAQAADANILPQITYAFVRGKARKMSA